MSLKKSFFVALILMLIIPIVVILLLSLGLFGAIMVEGKRSVGEFIDINKNSIQQEMKPDGIIFQYVMVIGVAAVVTVGLSCAALIFYLSRRVLTPLRELKRAAENISGGNLDFEVLSSNVSEVNELCVAFDRMRRRLKESVSDTLAYERNRSAMRANISHDLRTPVTSIKGYVEGIRDGVTTTPEMTERYLSTVLNKVNVLQRMVDQMSDFSELELGKMSFDFKILDAVEFLRSIGEEYTLDFESEDATLEISLPEGEIYVMLDRDKMRRVIINILSNAIKYRSSRPLKVIMYGERSENGIEIMISDNGKGINKDDLMHVFEGFYRGDPARSGETKGHGLGLTIAKQIVERHRGKIWLKSESGVGTEVHLHLPQREKGQLSGSSDN